MLGHLLRIRPAISVALLCTALNHNQLTRRSTPDGIAGVMRYGRELAACERQFENGLGDCKNFNVIVGSTASDGRLAGQMCVARQEHASGTGAVGSTAALLSVLS